MVELQACASGLVNPCGLCATIDHESKGENVNVIAQMADELQRERQRNAELMERISFLEAKLLEERVMDSQLADKLVRFLSYNLVTLFFFFFFSLISIVFFHFVSCSECPLSPSISGKLFQDSGKKFQEA